MCIYTLDVSASTDDLIFTAAHTHISSAKISLKIWQTKNKKTCAAEMLACTDLFPIQLHSSKQFINGASRDSTFLPFLIFICITAS